MNTDPINVLFVQHDASDIGGVAKVLIDLLATLHPVKIRATVILPTNGSLEEEFKKLNVEYIIIPSNIFPERNSDGGFEYISKLSERAEQISKIIFDKKIDIVHTHTIFPFEGSLSALKSGIPHILHIHSNCDDEIPAAIFFTLNISKSTIAKIYGILSDHIVTVSHNGAYYFKRNHILAPLKVIHNGINSDRFEKLSLPEPHNLPSIPIDSPVFTSIGRITESKNFFLFIYAAQLILNTTPNAYFLIVGPVGNLSYAEKLKKYIFVNNLQNNIYFLGMRKDIPSILKHCTNIFIMSSDYEGLPLVTLEAMSAGIPVISTRCGGPEEIIEHKVSGFLVDKNDAEGIAKYALALLKDRELACKIGETGRQRVIDHFTVETFADNFYATYQQVIKQHDRFKQADRLAVVETFLSLLSHNATLHEKVKLIDSRLKLLEQFSNRITNNFIYHLFKKVYLFLTRQSAY